MAVRVRPGAPAARQCAQGAREPHKLIVEGSFPSTATLEMTCMSVLHNSPLHCRAIRLREFDSLHLLRDELTEWLGPPLQPASSGFDSPARLYAPKVFVAARRLAKSQERVQLSLGAPWVWSDGRGSVLITVTLRRSGFDSRQIQLHHSSSGRASAFQAEDVDSISTWCSKQKARCRCPVAGRT